VYSPCFSEGTGAAQQSLCGSVQCNQPFTSHGWSGAVVPWSMIAYLERSLCQTDCSRVNSQVAAGGYKLVSIIDYRLTTGNDTMATGCENNPVLTSLVRVWSQCVVVYNLRVALYTMLCI